MWWDEVWRKMWWDEAWMKIASETEGLTNMDMIN